MNEKIKALAEQARSWVDDAENVPLDVEYVIYKDAYDQKFAELIVQECLKTISGKKIVDDVTEWEQGYNKALKSIYHTISGNLGVEE
jgi:hypothetical protein